MYRSYLGFCQQQSNRQYPDSTAIIASTAIPNGVCSCLITALRSSKSIEWHNGSSVLVFFCALPWVRLHGFMMNDPGVAASPFVNSQEYAIALAGKFGTQ
jgi:hypothetical protein